MQSPFSGALASVDAEKRGPTGRTPPPTVNPMRADGAPTLSQPTPARLGLGGARLRKFLSYYRPHIGLLLADLGCAALVSATTLGLPLCANYVVKQLTHGGASPAFLQQIWIMGA